MHHFSQGNIFTNGKNNFVLLYIIRLGMNAVRVELKNTITNHIYEKTIEEFTQALNENKLWKVH